MALVLGVLVLASGLTAVPSYYLEDNLFVSKPHKLTLGIPKDWGVQPDEDANGGRVALLTRTKGRANIAVIVRPLKDKDEKEPEKEEPKDNKLSLEQIIERNLATEIRGFKITGSQVRSIAGLPFYELVGIGSAGDRSYILLATAANEKLYSFFLACNKDIFPQVQKEFEDSLRYLKIEVIHTDKEPT